MAKRRLVRTKPRTSTTGSLDPATLSPSDIETPPGSSFASSTSLAPYGDTRSTTIATEELASAVSQETTGRSWPDIVYQYSSNPNYLYVIVPVTVMTLFGITGNMKTTWDLAMAALVSAIGCIAISLVRKLS